MWVNCDMHENRFVFDIKYGYRVNAYTEKLPKDTECTMEGARLVFHREFFFPDQIILDYSPLSMCKNTHPMYNQMNVTGFKNTATKQGTPLPGRVEENGKMENYRGAPNGKVQMQAYPYS